MQDYTGVLENRVPRLILAFVITGPITVGKSDRFVFLLFLWPNVGDPRAAFGFRGRWFSLRAWGTVNGKPVKLLILGLVHERRFLWPLLTQTFEQKVIQTQVVTIKSVCLGLAF